MRIMFLHSSMRAGGAERMISALANYYAGQGIEVSVAIIDNLPSFYPLHPKVQFLNLSERRKSINVWQAIKNNFQLIKKCRKAVKKVRPDCIVCFDINTLVYALVAKAFLNIAVVGSERSNPHHDAKDFWHRMKKYATPFADGYVFQTNGAKSFYPKTVQMKSVVIPNGLFIGDLPSVVKMVDREPDSICAVGRLHYIKGYDVLISAFARFLRNYPSYKLTIYGEGSERKNLEKLIYEMGLQQKVILAGRITNVLDEISKQTIYILSSRFEGMPNALMEGLACGCACISTDCDFGPRELIADEENGLLVKVEDIDSMLVAMEKLASDEKLVAKIATNALNIRNTHSMEQIANRYLAYIEKRNC